MAQTTQKPALNEAAAYQEKFLRFENEVAPALEKSLALSNVNQIPRLQKIVVNIGLGEALDNPKALDAAVGDLNTITGQRPVVTKARKSIANFKLREGRAIGAKVTLRGERMWAFLRADGLVAARGSS